MGEMSEQDVSDDGRQEPGPLAPEGFLAQIWERSEKLPRETFLGSVISVCRRSLVLAFSLPVTHALLVVAFAVTTFFCLMFFYGVQYGVDFLERAGGKLTLTLFLSDPSASTGVEAELRQLPQIESWQFVTPDKAFEELQGALGDRRDIFAGIDPRTAIPASYDVVVSDVTTSDPRARDAVLAAVKKIPGVSEVISSHDLVGRLHELLHQLSIVGWVSALLAILLVVFVGFSTQRLALLIRRQEFNIMALVGASPVFIGAPVIVVGFAFGLLGGGLGAILFLGVTKWLLLLVSSDPNTLPLIASSPRVSGYLALSVAIGAAVGTLASTIAVLRRHSDIR